MIMDAIRQAQRRLGAVIEQTYDGTCNIYEQKPVKDPDTKVTSHKEVPVHEGVPCHLSFSGTSPAAASGTVTAVAQTIKLFLAPELNISPGSRIEVSQQGRTESYAQSSKAAAYPSHQEILLELWKGYA